MPKKKLNKEEEKLRKVIRSKKSSPEEAQKAHCELEAMKSKRQWDTLKSKE